jgi:hypothetical protein
VLSEKPYAGTGVCAVVRFFRGPHVKNTVTTAKDIVFGLGVHPQPVVTYTAQHQRSSMEDLKRLYEDAVTSVNAGVSAASSSARSALGTAAGTYESARRAGEEVTTKVEVAWHRQAHMAFGR